MIYVLYTTISTVCKSKVMWVCNVLLPLFKFNWKEVFIMSRKNIKNQASQNFYMLHKALFVNEKYKN